MTRRAGTVASLLACAAAALPAGCTERGGPAAPDASAAEIAEKPAASPAGEPRCKPIAEPFVIGDAPPPAPPQPQPERSAPGEPGEPEPDPLAPFAVEVGRATVREGGFAAGALRDAEGGTIAMVALLDAEGRGGKLVRLARSRGDMDPPVVAARGATVLAAMMEPNAGGRAIKLAKLEGERVTWGIELAEGRDESLAVDLAIGGERGLVVWDDVDKQGKRSSVMMASFDVATLRSVTAARPVSPPRADAEMPRLIARPGGYWLAYLARVLAPPAPAEKPKGHDREGEAEEEDGPSGEPIENRWVEVVPLDEAGAAVSTPRAISPKDGHVLAFDVELGEGGGLLVAWRDDDTPSGSSGGRVSATLVTLGGVAEAQVLAEEGVGSGLPDLLPGWIAVPDVSGATRLAGMTGDAKLVGALDPEPSLGGGEPLAATPAGILLARPAGKAMRLVVVRCSRAAPAGDAAAP